MKNWQHTTKANRRAFSLLEQVRTWNSRKEPKTVKTMLRTWNSRKEPKPLITIITQQKKLCPHHLNTSDLHHSNLSQLKFDQTKQKTHIMKVYLDAVNTHSVIPTRYTHIIKPSKLTPINKLIIQIDLITEVVENNLW